MFRRARSERRAASSSWVYVADIWRARKKGPRLRGYADVRDPEALHPWADPVALLPGDVERDARVQPGVRAKPRNPPKQSGMEGGGNVLGTKPVHKECAKYTSIF